MEEKTRELVKGMLNFIEQLSSNLREARVENQRLRDENNRLKGEQGKPEIKANVEAERAKTHHRDTFLTYRICLIGRKGSKKRTYQAEGMLMHFEDINVL